MYFIIYIKNEKKSLSTFLKVENKEPCLPFSTGAHGKGRQCHPPKTINMYFLDGCVWVSGKGGGW